jgi:hypothetical protein
MEGVEEGGLKKSLFCGLRRGFGDASRIWLIVYSVLGTIARLRFFVVCCEQK